ncbi:MAG: DUF547 domain-containing protein [Alphaproteobacteria bacterium]|nr:DUF547 domain-containing protein [Alphaproteobacteria bacterium]
MSATDQANGAACPLSRRVLLGAAIGLGLAGIAPRPAAAAPRAELWPRWQRHDAASTRRVDHAPWDAILAAHHRRGADGIARFAYAEAKAAGAPAALRRYLDALQATDVDALARPEQMAYWINLYNALTVATVLDRYPVESIRDIRTSPGLFAIGPWGAKVARVAGEALSLDDIEHRILRPIWRDARIHYAVNCAALGCPDLQPRAFRAASLDATLDRAARAFVNHPRAARIDARGRLVVSSIYHWFAADFGDGSERAILAHVTGLAEPALAARLAGRAGYDSHAYDWRLNRWQAGA